MKRDFLIRDASYRDVKTIKKICDFCLGENYISEQEFKNIIDDEDSFLRVFEENDKVQAFLYFLIADYENAKSILHIPDERDIPGVSKESKVSVMKTAGTDNNVRGKGDFSLLVKDAQDILGKKDVALIASAGLKDPSGNTHIRGTLEAEDYSEIMEIETPWIDIDSPCPHCKKNNCVCNAVIFAKFNRR